MVNHLAWVGGPRDFGMAQYQYHLISLWKCLCMFSFLLHFTGVIWTGPQTVHKTQMGKHSAQCQLSMEWYTGAEEKWSVRVREAATDKRITPLLSTPGAVTPEQRNTVQKGRTLIFFRRHAHMVWARQSLLCDILSRSAQCKDMFLAQAQTQHPEVWPCPPANLPPDTPDGWTWYLA